MEWVPSRRKSHIELYLSRDMAFVVNEGKKRRISICQSEFLEFEFCLFLIILLFRLFS